MSTTLGLSPRLRRRLVVVGAVVLVLLVWGAVRPFLASGESGPPYAFMDTQDDGVTPVTYDPCVAIGYWMDPDGAIDGGAELVVEAVAEVAAATGLTFAPVDERDAVVTIRWITPAEEPELDGDVVGYGGSSGTRTDDGWRWTEGGVDLDAPDLADIADDEGTDAVRGVVMHELAHVVGLSHVDDRGQLMHPSSSRSTWGSGDLAGLAQLGGPCVRD